MPTKTDTDRAFDALAEAGRLYGRYVELARISEIPRVCEVDAAVTAQAVQASQGVQPLGFVLTPKNRHAIVE